VPVDPEITIEIATTANDDLVAAFDRLIPQLSSSFTAARSRWAPDNRR
jgi:hypothetical protein